MQNLRYSNNIKLPMLQKNKINYSRSQGKLVKFTLQDPQINDHLFQSLIKQNFNHHYKTQNSYKNEQIIQHLNGELKYQKTPKMSKKLQKKINSFQNEQIQSVALEEDNYSKPPKVNVSQFEKHIQNNNNGDSIVSYQLSSFYTKDSNQNSQIYGNPNNLSIIQRQRQSYFMQDEFLPLSFQKSIQKDNSFCFKSIPRSKYHQIDIRKQQDESKTILQNERFKYEISPLIKQDIFSQQNQSKLYCIDKEEDEKTLLNKVDFDKLKNMHQNNDLSDKNQKELRQQVQNYQNWKQVRNHRLKQQKIIAEQFKSGILNVDGPLNDQSSIYKEVNNKILKEFQQNQQKQEIHKQIIAKQLGTHHYIEISNVYNSQQNDQLNVPIKQYDGEIQLQHKKPVNIDYRNYFKDTTNYDGVQRFQDLILKSQKRKVFLRNQNRGKSYDIVSNTNFD